MRKLLTGLTAMLAVALATQAAAQGSMPPENGVLNKMMGVHKFDTFLELVREADLTRMFMGNQSYTFFAPTQEAFDRMGNARVQALRNNPAAARRFVLAHVVRGAYTAQQAVRAKRLRTLGGTTLRFHNVHGSGRIGNASFTLTNVMARNGVVHGIDSATPTGGWGREG